MEILKGSYHLGTATPRLIMLISIITLAPMQLVFLNSIGCLSKVETPPAMSKMLEYSCYSKVRNENLPVSLEIPVAEPKVVMNVWYFDMVEIFWDKLLCAGKGPIAELTKPYPNMSTYAIIKCKNLHLCHFA